MSTNGAKSNAQARRDELRRLKDERELTFEQLAALTGYNAIVLNQWATGGKPLKERTLRAIRLTLQSQPKSGA